MNKTDDQKRVAVVTLGCKVNQYESAAFLSAFEAAGCRLVDAGEGADIVVVNTCAVTSRAAAQSRQEIRRILRQDKNTRVVVTGCHAQTEAERLRRIHPGLVIIGNADKQELVPNILADARPASPGDIARQKEISRLPVAHFNGRTRAFLRIQDGCDNFCSYCIVPHARGRSRSLPSDEVLRQAWEFARQGHREIVITGIHTGMYGRDLQPDFGLSRLLRSLCRELPHVRFRLSSLEPMEISDDILELIAAKSGIMPHLHIPLQSGDDDILARMHRRYRAADFAHVVQRVLDAAPETAIGVDVMAAFPGENDAAFANTLALLRDLPLASLHVFPYSRRPGTQAAALPGQISRETKEKRARVLRELGRDKRQTFCVSQIGRVCGVLTESRDTTGRWRGLSDTYLPVLLEGDAGENQLVTVRLEKITGKVMTGKAVHSEAA